jgi:hypothetical protein
MLHFDSSLYITKSYNIIRDKDIQKSGSKTNIKSPEKGESIFCGSLM